jgi:hypothetical protein
MGAEAAEVQPYGIRQPVSWISIFPPTAGSGPGSMMFEADSCPGCEAPVLIGNRSFFSSGGRPLSAGLCSGRYHAGGNGMVSERKRGG